MKITTIFAAIAIASSTFAANPAQLVEEQKWQELVYTYNFSRVTNVITDANKAYIFDASSQMTNNALTTVYLARDGYGPITTAYAQALRLNDYDAAWLCVRYTTNQEWQVEVFNKAFADEAFKRKRPSFCLTVIITYDFPKKNEAEFLRFADKALAAKDWFTASAPFCYWQSVETANMKAWREANIKDVVDGIVAAPATSNSKYHIYNRILLNLAKIDIKARDFSNKATMPYFKSDMVVTLVNFYYSGQWLNDSTFGKAFATAFFKNSNDPKEIFALCKRYPANRQVAVLQQNFAKLAKDNSIALDAAILMNDIEKIIDVLLVSTDNLTAAQISSIIAPLNAVDADYRKDDIAKILRNINSKYTINLYNDRDVWEPLLSKIRAMLDVRQ